MTVCLESGLTWLVSTMSPRSSSLCTRFSSCCCVMCCRSSLLMSGSTPMASAISLNALELSSSVTCTQDCFRLLTQECWAKLETLFLTQSKPQVAEQRCCSNRQRRLMQSEGRESMPVHCLPHQMMQILNAVLNVQDKDYHMPFLL